MSESQFPDYFGQQCKNIKLAAAFRSKRFENGSDYAEIAFVIENHNNREIQLSTKWKSESHLFEIILKLYPDAIRQHSPDWLGSQRIDIFIPSINLAIEYNGKQHYEPVNFFGGAEGLKKAKKRDEKKIIACECNGIKLLNWHYRVPVTKDNVEKMINSII